MLAVIRRRSSWLVVLLCTLISTLVGVIDAQEPPSPPVSFRIVRIAAGPRGSEVGGQFRLEQERITFNRSSDTQVVVYFQWDGAPGLHRMAGRWRSPAGGVAISEFEYNARDRLFGAYWTLPISPSTPLGTWSIEATIDGLPSGAFTFEVVDGDVPPPGVARRPLPPSELYRQLGAVYVDIDRMATRSLIDTNGGFVIGPSSVATAFSAIDAADRIEMTMAGSGRESVTSIAAWDRQQDWAVIPAVASAGPVLPIASPDSAEVGHRCYSMEGGSADRRTLTECTVVGRTTAEAAGARFIVQFLSGRGIPGAPVVNEFGEVIGLVGGAPSGGFRGFRASLGQGVPVVPVSVIRAVAGGAASLQDLKRRGVLMLAVNGGDNILSGGFARQIQRNPVRPVDQREEFTQADGRFFVFLSWDPKERLRGTLVLRAYDEDNQLLSESKPGKVDFKPGTVRFSQWELSVPRRPGRYRTDVLLGDVPIWRGFYRVAP